MITLSKIDRAFQGELVMKFLIIVKKIIYYVL